MAGNNKVYTLITALAVVLALMGLIFVIAQNDGEAVQVVEKQGVSEKLITISKEVPKESIKTNVVTSDYVRNLDGNANLVVMTEDGSAYAVKGGNFLVQDRLVTIDDEGKTVYYVNDPKKSVETK